MGDTIGLVDPAVLGPYLLAVSLVELTPGPNMTWLAVVSASRGRRAGLAAVAGVTAGLAAWLLAAVFGLTETLARWPAVFQALRWAGVLFLVWLAWEAWRDEAESSPGRARGDEAAAGLFRRGLVGNLLNPKAAVFYVALLPGFVRPERGDPLAQALVLGGLHLAVSVAVHGAIVLGAERAGRLAAGAGVVRAGRGASALAILAVALWLAWETR